MTSQPRHQTPDTEAVAERMLSFPKRKGQFMADIRKSIDLEAKAGAVAGVGLLAALEQKCEACKGTGKCHSKPSGYICPGRCLGCRGSGTVALIPGLRGFCDFCGGDTTSPCEDCEDRHYSILTVPEAARVLRLRGEFRHFVTSFRVWVPNYQPHYLGVKNLVDLLCDDNLIIAAGVACFAPQESRGA